MVGEYEGEVGKYEGEVGEYEGEVGEYEGEVGEYEGEVGEYEGEPMFDLNNLYDGVAVRYHKSMSGLLSKSPEAVMAARMFCNTLIGTFAKFAAKVRSRMWIFLCSRSSPTVIPPSGARSQSFKSQVKLVHSFSKCSVSFPDWTIVLHHLHSRVIFKQ